MNLIWFRNDLRVDDNPALWHACHDVNGNNSDELTIAVYFICESQWTLHGVGNNQRRLIAKALSNLKDSLNQLNIPLLIIEADNYQSTVTELTQLCLDLNVTDVYFNTEYPVNEKARDKQVKDSLNNISQCHSYHDQCLVAPDKITNNAGLGYKVFSAYARAVNRHLAIDPVACYSIPDPKNKTNFKLIESTHYNQYLDSEFIANNKNGLPLPEMSENHLSKQLFDFCANSIIEYAQNRDIPSITGTSSLSAGLALGSLSIKRCYLVANKLANEKATSWINELIWRDFYRSVIWHFPRVSKNQAFDKVDNLLIWSKDQTAFDLWEKGQTGIPIIDAAINQLIQTGWMHNRLRMVVASYLTKNLWIDWRQGERFFAEHLFDYDFASNNGGWQWCASVGTDAAPYFRVFNPASQQKRFDPEAIFIKQWLPQLSDFSAKQIHQFETKPLAGYYPLQVDLKSSRKQAIESFKIAKSNLYSPADFF